MSNINTWKLYLFSSLCFLFAGIMDYIDKNYFIGSLFILLFVIYMWLSIAQRKKESGRNLSKTEVPTDVQNDMDIELKTLIAEGKKYEAMKKYRIVTGLGLKEAKEYIDLLSNNME